MVNAQQIIIELRINQSGAQVLRNNAQELRNFDRAKY